MIACRQAWLLLQQEASWGWRMHKQVSEEEAAAGLGPEWPHPRMLSELQRQAVALSHEAVDARKREAPGAGRARHLCAMLLSILSTTRRLQVLGERLHPYACGACTPAAHARQD